MASMRLISNMVSYVSAEESPIVLRSMFIELE